MLHKESTDTEFSRSGTEATITSTIGLAKEFRKAVSRNLQLGWCKNLRSNWRAQNLGIPSITWGQCSRALCYI